MRDRSIVAVKIGKWTKVVNGYALDRPDEDRVIASVVGSMQRALETRGDARQYRKAVDSFVIPDSLKLVFDLRCKMLRKITLVLAENINNEDAWFV